jgi:hypothetical protein
MDEFLFKYEKLVPYRKIKSIGNKKLYKNLLYKVHVYVSYKTAIGIVYDDVAYFTTEEFSPSTRRHKQEARRHCEETFTKNVNEVDYKEFKDIIEKILNVMNFENLLDMPSKVS